jgi:hypothetical protein
MISLKTARYSPKFNKHGRDFVRENSRVHCDACGIIDGGAIVPAIRIESPLRAPAVGRLTRCE